LLTYTLTNYSIIMVHCGFVDFKFGCTSYLSGPKEALKIWE